MAANYSYNRKIVDKLTVKGKLSSDLVQINYADKDKGQVDIAVEDCLKYFAGKDITFSITLAEEEDLAEEDE